MGRSRMEGLGEPFDFPDGFWSPTCTLTLQTRPSLTWMVTATHPSCHWFLGRLSSLMMTMSFTWRLHQKAWHFCCVERFKRCSFSQWLQNCSNKYGTFCHCFAAYICSFTNFPGGGRATLDFIRIRWFGVKGSSDIRLLIPSIFSGRLLTMGSFIEESSKWGIIKSTRTVRESIWERHAGDVPRCHQHDLLQGHWK